MSTGGYPVRPDEEALYKAADDVGRDPEAAVAVYRIRRQLAEDPLGFFAARAAVAGSVITTAWMVPNDALWEAINDPQAPRIESKPFPVSVSPTLQTALWFAGAYHWFLLLAAGLGACFVVRVPRLALVISVPLYFVLVHIPTLFLERYFLPAMPALAVLAATGLLGVYRLASRRNPVHAVDVAE